eukprot:TRINITY_DN1454_c0_g1_i2.p1 TRINITY_DN1454_c0_g1~~TRINITY_DN1454_c0_g1_i2.p1  ORF type:complete len:234 (+),score=74.39 TRINITY_DN1454_c0_g1_i2:91-792(+)
MLRSLVGSEMCIRDRIVGNHMWTRTACTQLGMANPEPPDYPECLEHLLHRKIWTSTLGEMANYVQTAEHQTFIKPAVDAKTFSAVIEPQDQMLEVFLNGIPGTTMHAHPPEMSVFCSEVVDMVVEYRVYVVNGEVRAVCHYGAGPKDMEVDMEVVNQAIHTMAQSDECKDVVVGCGIDFAVLRKKDAEGSEELVTCLVEVNDGFSLGVYDGFEPKDHADLLIARWAQLLKGIP